MAARVDDPNGSQRIFIGLWPDDDVRARLDGLATLAERAGAGGRRVAAANLHLTLAFLGELEAPAVRAVRDTTMSLQFPPSTLILDRLGFWSRTGILWCGSREPGVELVRFVTQLRDRLARLGFRPDRRPFAPHVTLFRKARRRPRVRIKPILWELREVCVIRSTLLQAGARYEIVSGGTL